jgi:hypothetical protein
VSYVGLSKSLLPPIILSSVTVTTAPLLVLTRSVCTCTHTGGGREVCAYSAQGYTWNYSCRHFIHQFGDTRSDFQKHNPAHSDRPSMNALSLCNTD